MARSVRKVSQSPNGKCNNIHIPNRTLTAFKGVINRTWRGFPFSAYVEPPGVSIFVPTHPEVPILERVDFHNSLL